MNKTSANHALFQSFAKGASSAKAKCSDCVINIHISINEQADTNMSLDVEESVRVLCN